MNNYGVITCNWLYQAQTRHVLMQNILTWFFHFTLETHFLTVTYVQITDVLPTRCDVLNVYSGNTSCQWLVLYLCKAPPTMKYDWSKFFVVIQSCCTAFSVSVPTDKRPVTGNMSHSGCIVNLYLNQLNIKYQISHSQTQTLRFFSQPSRHNPKFPVSLFLLPRGNVVTGQAFTSIHTNRQSAIPHTGRPVQQVETQDPSGVKSHRAEGLWVVMVTWSDCYSSLRGSLICKETHGEEKALKRKRNGWKGK